MYELMKNGKVYTSKFVGTGPSSYKKKKRIYRAAVSQRLRNTALEGDKMGLNLIRGQNKKELILLSTNTQPGHRYSILLTCLITVFKYL
jgi:hypothetical protein